MRIMVTGVTGFIGSYFAKYMLARHPDVEIVGVNRLTNSKNLKRLDGILDNPRFTLHYLDIARDQLADAFQDVDTVVNYAAKTFVDYSIRDPWPFIESNLVGTFKVLEEARRAKNAMKLFIQISTDEVYGAILDGAYKEDSRLNPSNPYAASKAGGDMLVRSYANTYGLPSIIVRNENIYGPFQGREKAVPTFVRNALTNTPLPIFGDGGHTRCWCNVEDHCRAIEHLMTAGKRTAEIYHIAGEHELKNIDLAKLILRLCDKSESMYKLIDDHDIRPGHDRRYALSVQKLKDTGWSAKWGIEDGFKEVVQWYVAHKDWFM